MVRINEFEATFKSLLRSRVRHGIRTKNDEKKVSLFKAPADPERRSKWERKLRRADKALVACSLQATFRAALYR